MNLSEICKTCELCTGLVPEQPRFRTLSEGFGDSSDKILLIDDAFSATTWSLSKKKATELFQPIGFTYTTSIRCETFSTPTIADEEIVLSRCSVWTNLLLDGKQLIVSTKYGLKQLKIASDISVGEAFRSSRLGIILCIPPILALESKVYRTKIQRAIKEAGL